MFEKSIGWSVNFPGQSSYFSPMNSVQITKNTKYGELSSQQKQELDQLEQIINQTSFQASQVFILDTNFSTRLPRVVQSHKQVNSLVLSVHNRVEQSKKQVDKQLKLAEYSIRTLQRLQTNTSFLNKYFVELEKELVGAAYELKNSVFELQVLFERICASKGCDGLVKNLKIQQDIVLGLCGRLSDLVKTVEDEKREFIKLTKVKGDPFSKTKFSQQTELPSFNQVQNTLQSTQPGNLFSTPKPSTFGQSTNFGQSTTFGQSTNGQSTVFGQPKSLLQTSSSLAQPASFGQSTFGSTAPAFSFGQQTQSTFGQSATNQTQSSDQSGFGFSAKRFNQ